MLEAVGRLSRRQAVAITLRVFEELPYELMVLTLAAGLDGAASGLDRVRGLSDPRLRLVQARGERRLSGAGDLAIEGG